MDYFDIGDTISRADLNSIVYLLRKFKRLTKDLNLGPSKIETEYGTFNFSDGFRSTGNNWILENDVTITSDNVLTNTFYTFVFNVIDVNMSGSVNTRTVSVTSPSTGDYGILEVVVGEDILSEGEVLLPDYTLSITFDEHEYYTPLSEYSVELSVEKEKVLLYEDNTIYLTLTHESEPVAYALTSIVIDGDEFFSTTDDEGVAEFTYTGKGAGLVTVTTPLDNTASVSFIDNPDYVSATVTSSTVTLGKGGGAWLKSDGQVIVDWGDEATTLINNPTTALTHTYTDNESSHEIKFIGEITGLGDNCFNGVTGLTGITLLNGITSLGNSCFYECSSLTSVSLPETITKIGDNCFKKCSSLTGIIVPENVTDIGYGCFRQCTSLASVTLPSNMTVIKKEFFYQCSSLTSVTLPSGIVTVGDDCFRACSGLTSMVFPEGVTTIGDRCFNNCTSLTSVVVPNTVVSIGLNFVYGCTSLTSVTLSNNITALNYRSFYGCTSLTSLNIPKNVTSLGAECFRGCSNLTGIVIPNSVTDIGESCFRTCSSLTSINIPKNVVSIGNTCFSGCTGLVDYQLYWTGENIIPWDDAHLVNNTNTTFTLPNGTYDLYVDKEYPLSKLIERGYRLELSVNNPIISENESSTITATLYNNGVVATSKTLKYSINHGNSVITSGSKTTNSSGKATISYTGTSIGEVEVIVKYSNITQKSIKIKDTTIYDVGTSSNHNDIWTQNSSNPGILTRYADYSIESQQSSGSPGQLTYTFGGKTGKIIEFDLKLSGSESRVTFRDSSNIRNTINESYYGDLTDFNHFIVDFDANICKNTTNGFSRSISENEITRIFFEARGDNEQVYFKNFCIYSTNLGNFLSISSDKTRMYTDESVVIKGILLNDGLPVSNASVTIYNGETSLGTVTTNQDGEYAKTITGLSAGTYAFKATYNTSETNTIDLTVINHTYSLSIARNKSTIYEDESVIISGVLLKDNIAFPNQTVTIYDGNTNKGTATTNANGAYSITLTDLTAGSHTISAQHPNATSSDVNVTVNNHTYSLTAAASKSTIYTDESTILSGTLKKDNVAWANQKISIYDGTKGRGSVTTGSDGKYSKTLTNLTAGSHTIKAKHSTVTSNGVNVTVNNHTYSLTASLGSNSIYTDGSTKITGTLKRDGKVYANQEVTIYNGSTSLGTVSTNNNGVYTKTLNGLTAGTYTLKAVYGDTNSSTVNLTVKNHVYTVSATVSPVEIYSNQSTTIQGTLTKDGNVYANQTVTIYDGSSQIATASTDSSGNFRKELAGLSLGQHSLRAGYSGVYSGSTVVTVTDAYELTISSNKNSYIAGETTTITGSLLRNGSGVNYAYVYLYEGDTLLSRRITNLHGDYTYSYQFEHGSHTIRAVYNNSVEASTTFTVTDYDVTMTTSSASIYSDQSVTISGTLLRGGVGYSGQTVTIYDGNTSLTTVTTGTGGAFSKSVSGLSVGSHNLRAEYSGVYSSTNSVTVTVAYTLTASVSPTTIYTDGSVTVSGILTHHGSGYADKFIKIYDGDSEISVTPFTTGNDGSYTKSVGGFTAGQHSIKTAYGSYITSSATNITVNNHTYSLTGTTSKDAYYTDETLVFTGVLKKDGSNWGSQEVEIYVDGSYEDTVTTDSSGAYSFNVGTFSITGQHTLQAKHSNVDSTVKTITVNAHTYSLTAGASPTTITYGQSTTVSGVLSKDGSGWTGQTIQIKQGSSVLAEGTSGTSGAYSISVSGLSVGSHTIKAVCNNLSSSNMSVTVNKIDTTTSLSASSTSISTTDTLTLSGAVTGASSGTVKIYNGSTLVADNVSVTSGSFSKNLTGLSAGTYNYKAVFQSDSTHNSSESSVVQVTVTSPAHTYTLEVTCDTPVIQSGDTVTIYAQVLDNGVPYDDPYDLNYVIKHGSTTISSGVGQLSLDNKVHIPYTGTGVGDVSVIVSQSSMLLQETFVIEDCKLYNDCTTNTVENIWNVPSSVKSSSIYGFSSNGWTFGNVSSWTDIVASITLPTIPFEVGFRLNGYNRNGLTFNIGQTGSTWKSISTTTTTGKIQYTGTDIKAVSVGSVYSMKCYSDRTEVYEDGTLIYTDNNAITTVKLQWGSGSNRSVTIKDFKIKAL